MKRPPWEVADIIRKAGRRFIDHFEKFLIWPRLKVLNAIERLPDARWVDTATNGNAADTKPSLTTPAEIGHCPKCQTNARDKWLAARQQCASQSILVSLLARRPRRREAPLRQ